MGANSLGRNRLRRWRIKLKNVYPTIGGITSGGPGGALGAIDPAIGFFVFDELPGGGVPLERAIQPVADVAQVTDGDAVCADFDRADALMAGSDAAEPVFVMAWGFVEEGFADVGGDLLQFFGRGF